MLGSVQPGAGRLHPRRDDRAHGAAAGDPLLIGTHFYQQWLALWPSATGCPSLGCNLSNALRLEVQ